jgi:hypothetical protein
MGKISICRDARCAMERILKAQDRWQLKANLPPPDLTNAAFKKRLHDYPGVIVSSIILRPNGELIPKTLRENGVSIPPHAWSVKDLRDLHQYMSGVIQNNETANYQRAVQP